MSFTLRPLLAAFAAASASAVVCLFIFIILESLQGGSGVPLAPLVLMAAFIVSLFHAFVFGLPLYALASVRWRRPIWPSLGASFLVGALPLPLVVLLLTGGDLGEQGLDPVSWLLALAGGFGVVGMTGGFTFWLIMREHAK